MERSWLSHCSYGVCLPGMWTVSVCPPWLGLSRKLWTKFWISPRASETLETKYKKIFIFILARLLGRALYCAIGPRGWIKVFISTIKMEPPIFFLKIYGFIEKAVWLLVEQPAQRFSQNNDNHTNVYYFTHSRPSVPWFSTRIADSVFQNIWKRRHGDLPNGDAAKVPRLFE